MNKRTLSLGLAMGLLAIAGCDNDRSARNATASNDGNDAVKQAGDTTIAKGLDQKGRFFTLAKAAGLDLTLEGPGPYTVFVPSDAAFDKLPAGTADGWSKPENRATLTRTLLAEDIGKAIDNGKGKAQLATVGGTALTATKDGDRIVLTDGAGGKATITRADVTRANGVVHETDAVLMPGEAS
jgi:uncharacterized surface protein with fasciclin (FAS1) repeats